MTAAYFIGGSMDLTKRRIPGGERFPPDQEWLAPVGGDSQYKSPSYEVYRLAYSRVVGEGSLAVYVYEGTRS